MTKVDESYDIPQYFFGPITYFCSISFNCNVLLAFHNFVLWRTKFFCLLLYHFASRQYWQIFCHCQTKGDISNIADGVLGQRKCEKAFLKFVCLTFKKKVIYFSKIWYQWWRVKTVYKNWFLRNRIKPKLACWCHYWKYCFLFLHDCGKWQRLRQFNKKCLFSQFNTFEICILRVKNKFY